MNFKKAGGQIFGVDLTKAERDALNKEIYKAIMVADEQYIRNYQAMALSVLHKEFGWGKDRIRKFYDAFKKQHKDLLHYYEMPDEEAFLCRKMLESELNIDLDKWDKES